MGSISEWALKCAVHDRVRKDTKLARTLAETADGMSTGRYPTELVRATAQTVESSSDMYDAFVFLQLYHMICGGTLSWCEADIGFVPSRDTGAQTNNTRLSRLPSHLKAEFAGGLGDFDGYVLIDGAAMPENLGRSRRLPLEVGYTKAATTLDHILFRGGVARWPHGSKRLTLLIKS